MPSIHIARPREAHLEFGTSFAQANAENIDAALDLPVHAHSWPLSESKKGWGGWGDMEHSIK